MNHRVPIISANNLNREVVVRYFFFFLLIGNSNEKQVLFLFLNRLFVDDCLEKVNEVKRVENDLKMIKKYYESKSRATACGSR